MFQAQPLLGVRSSANQAAADTGHLIDPKSYINQSATEDTSFGAGLATDASGEVGTAQTFEVQAPKTIQGRFGVFIRAPWSVTATAGGGAPLGTLEVTMLVNGEEAAVGRGEPRDLTSVDDPYVELIQLSPTTDFTLGPGGTLAFEVQLLVTTASGAGGSTCAAKLSHNPQNVPEQLVVELQGAQYAGEGV